MNSGKIPLVEGESPLDALLDLLDVSQKEFSRRIGVDDSTLRRWKSGTSEARFSLTQIKALKRELEAVGLSLEDLPDSFSPYKSA
jgi:transcriptional regulator with XRE-family HTH domain